jgi:Leucine-rich repeat (LRR) protein
MINLIKKMPKDFLVVISLVILISITASNNDYSKIDIFIGFSFTAYIMLVVFRIVNLVKLIKQFILKIGRKEARKNDYLILSTIMISISVFLAIFADNTLFNNQHDIIKVLITLLLLSSTLVYERDFLIAFGIIEKKDLL